MRYTAVFCLFLMLAFAPFPTSALETGAADGEPVAEEASSPPDPQDPSTFDDAIVVTARKREEDPQTIPIALTTFSADAIQELSMEDLSEVADWAPNVNFTIGGGFADQNGEATVFIRGVGQIDTAIFSDPAVGIYVDGVYLARSQGAVFDLLDLERIEILRGPQGTLFGKNTTGGAISLITKKPTAAFSARVAATLGDYSRRDLQGSLGGRLTDGLDASLALLSTQRDGYSRSLLTGQEFNDDDQLSARLALRWAPTDSLLFDLVGDLTQLREAPGNTFLLSLVDAPLLDFLQRSAVAGGFPVYTEQWVTPNDLDSFETFPGFYDSDVSGTSLAAGWTGRDVSVTSITAYRAVKVDAAGASDGSPILIAEREQDQDQDQFSQEIQVTGLGWNDALTWVVGAMYFDENPQEINRQRIFADIFPALEAAPGPIVSPPGVPAFLCDPGPPPPGVPCFGGAGNPLNLAFFVGDGITQRLDLDTQSTALFAEGTWEASDTVSVTAGLRWTRDEKTFDFVATDGFGTVTSDLFNQGDWDAFTPRLAVAWQLRPQTLLYASASRGFKSGGFNGRPQQRQRLDAFDPEKVWTYEVGLKSDFFNRRLRTNAAIFYSDYQDIQFAASLDVGGVPVFVTQNAGTARIQGFELEVEGQPALGLILTGRIGYLDNELTELDPGVPAGLEEGGRLPKTPEWTVSASVQKAWTLGDGGTKGSLIGRADYSYRTEFFNDAANSPGIVTDAYGLVNLRLLYSPPSGRWDVAAFVTNLADERYLENAFFAAAFGPNLGIPGRPREWGTTLEWRF
jgi:iron complex outermembrane recepter protein